MNLADSSRSALDKLVSIVIPIYNTESSLARCIESIQVQTFTELEIICLNDGSTDGSSRIAHEYASHDSRIAVVDKPNEGYGASCNEGIGLARGTWIAIVEPDDYLEPDCYANMLACANRYGGAEAVDVVKAPYWRLFIDENGNETRVSCPYKGRVHPRTQPFAVGDGAELLRHQPAIWAALYRRGYLKDRHIHFLEAPGSGWVDNAFLVETLCETDRIVYTDHCGYVYCERSLNEAEEQAKRDPLLPLERWNDMMDAAAYAGVSDRRVLSALALRGVNYALITVQSAGLDAPGVEELVRNSMSRLDANLVYSEPAISPAGKQLYAQVLGLSEPKGITVAGPYYAYLASEMIYRTRTNGIGFAARTARERLHGGRVG